jgi:hypothetical protein
MKKVENEYIEYNQLSIDQLMGLYESLHFIYPQKRERLNPVFSIIKENWTKALQSNFPLFWVGTIIQNKQNIVSSGTSWQYLNKGMLAQHLASNHPIGSRIIFLGMLNRVIENQHGGFIESYQIYYRPQNKFSARMFEPLSIRLGKDLSQIVPYNYCEVPLIKEFKAENVEVSEVNDTNQRSFLKFLKIERGEVYIKAQELDSADITLERLNEKFAIKGLHRKRRIFIACSKKDGQVYGSIIVNQGSLGLNFSFLENSSELILSEAPENYLLQVAGLLLLKASNIFPHFSLNYLPVLVNPAHSQIVDKLKGKVTRDYNLFIVLRGGYETWYEYVDNLTSAVFQRFLDHSYEQTITN